MSRPAAFLRPLCRAAEGGISALDTRVGRRRSGRRPLTKAAPKRRPRRILHIVIGVYSRMCGGAIKFGRRCFCVLSEHPTLTGKASAVTPPGLR